MLATRLADWVMVLSNPGVPERLRTFRARADKRHITHLDGGNLAFDLFFSAQACGVDKRTVPTRVAAIGPNHGFDRGIQILAGGCACSLVIAVR